MRVTIGLAVSLVSLLVPIVHPLTAKGAIVVAKPHSHGPGYIHYEEDGTLNGDDDHNHLAPHSVQGSAGAGHVHDAFAVWNNRSYNYGVGNATFTGGRQDDFWHGFITAGMEPRYKFIDGAGASKTFDATSKGIVSSAVGEWVTKAKAQSVGKTTPNGTLLETGIGLVETTLAAFEIRIGFFDNLIEKRGALAEWLVSDEQIWDGSGLVAAALDTSPILAFDDDISWLFDTTMTPTAAQYDFATITLHELGHVFGLLHAPGNPVGNIMRASIALEATDGKVLRSVDLSSANGAAELYTQPVPEPSAIVIFAGLGMIYSGIERYRRRRYAA